MESFVNREQLVVSPYWTPDHLDVTDVPLTYSRPKAAWIDGFAKLRPHLSSDNSERMARRRDHTHAIVDPAEITVLPPLAQPAPQRPAERRFTWRGILGTPRHA